MIEERIGEDREGEDRGEDRGKDIGEEKKERIEKNRIEEERIGEKNKTPLSQLHLQPSL